MTLGVADLALLKVMGSRLGVIATPITDGVEGCVLCLAVNEVGVPGELE